MKRQLALFSIMAGLGAACANPSLPPGGPPDRDPPVITAIIPEANSIGAVPKSVQLRFNEVISESPKTGSRLSDLVFISPRSGEPRVSWKRNRVEIRPANGWKSNTVYSVQIKPGIQDLRNNGIDSAVRIVFSTGGPIPDTRITGVAFDWSAAKGIVNAMVEAISTDSSVYQVVADSVGRFELQNLPSGPYVVRAYADRNNNREPDPLEIWDSTSVTLAMEATTELYAFVHDTVGLRIAEVVVSDTNRMLKLTFDKPYPSDLQFTPAMLFVTNTDSVRIPVRQVQTAPQKAEADSLAAKQRSDSIAAAAEAKLDTSQAARSQRDSLARQRVADSVAAVERTLQERQAAQAARARGGRPASVDTMPPPKMSRPRVYTEIFVSMEEPLAWQSQFRVQTNNVRSLSGTVKSPSRTFATPRAPAADTTAARPDSASAAPTSVQSGNGSGR